MRKIQLLIALSIIIKINSQTNYQGTMDLHNKVFPSSPSSSNLMKFEEVPVSYYTGIPDISVPLYNIGTSYKNLNISVELKYHPNNAKIEDKASEVGLGWSITSAGTITRTVRGVPDELIIDQDHIPMPSFSSQVGIYHDQNNEIFPNKTRHILDYLNEGIINYTEVERKRFLFEGALFNRFDLEYDLYQYDVMGYSGRFIIKKKANGTFEVKKLDENNLKIISQHNAATYAPESFKIIDDNGNQYNFDIVEYAERKNILTGTRFFPTIDPGSNPITKLGACASSFKISSIKDQNNNLLAEFYYNNASTILIQDYPVIKNRSFEYQPTIPLPTDPDPYPLAHESTTIETIFKNRTLDYIEIKNKAKIKFSYDNNRLDTNYFTANNYKPEKINSIILTKIDDTEIEKFNFIYNYFQFNTSEKRLKLEKLKNRIETILFYSTINSFIRNPMKLYQKIPGNLQNVSIQSVLM